MAGEGIKKTVNPNDDFKAAAADRVPIGMVKVERDMTITRMGMDGKMSTIEANAGDKVYAGDIVKTRAGGMAQIELRDKSVVSLASENQVNMSAFANVRDMGAGDATPRSLSTISGKVVSPGVGVKAEPYNQVMNIGVRG